MSAVIPRERIEQTILLIRGHRVMLSTAFADLYAVEPRVFIQAVKRNRDRFPTDFMFQLTEQEFNHLKSQIVISSWGGAPESLSLRLHRAGCRDAIKCRTE